MPSPLRRCYDSPDWKTNQAILEQEAWNLKRNAVIGRLRQQPATRLLVKWRFIANFSLPRTGSTSCTTKFSSHALTGPAPVLPCLRLSVRREKLWSPTSRRFSRNGFAGSPSWRDIRRGAQPKSLEHSDGCLKFAPTEVRPRRSPRLHTRKVEHLLLNRRCV